MKGRGGKIKVIYYYSLPYIMRVRRNMRERALLKLIKLTDDILVRTDSPQILIYFPSSPKPPLFEGKQNWRGGILAQLFFLVSSPLQTYEPNEGFLKSLPFISPPTKQFASLYASFFFLHGNCLFELNSCLNST